MQDFKNLHYTLAVSLLKGIGNKKAKDLIAYCGGAEQVFSATNHQLSEIPGIGKIGVRALNKKDALQIAEQEIEEVIKNDWKVFSYLDKSYPRRLKHCVDSPVMLYGKGNLNFDYDKTVSIVGTRKASNYGKQIVDELISSFQEHNVQIISGLAYGIDIHAHKECVKKMVSTVGVLAHGLDRLYPSIHRSTAERMMENGGLLTEFLPGTNPDRENFPTRNRIVAGMSDATIVVESGDKGGSLITAYMANDYNRDVFAFPGDVNRPYSRGCNKIIKQQKAHLTTCADDIIYLMNWEKKKEKIVQAQLFVDYTPEEQKIVDVLREKNEQSIDELALRLGLTVSQLSSTLLTLEFNGTIKSLPGKRYLLINPY